jgi:prolyl oligopeptidase
MLFQKIIEDTIVDVKFSGLSWRGNETITLVMKTKRKRAFCKTDEHKLYFHKLERLKEDKVIFGADQNADT